MGLFSSLKDAILSKISHRKQKQDSRNTSPDIASTPNPPAWNYGNGESEPTTGRQTPEAQAPAKLTAAELASQLDALAAESSEKLEWRTSIVDLMKLVGMDSSYAERKEMAIDLGYTKEDIDSKGSAEMNIWLHKKVMEKLSEDTDGDLTLS